MYHDLDPETAQYCRTEGIDPYFLAAKKENPLTPENFSQAIIRTADLIAQAAIEIGQFKREADFKLSRRGALGQILEAKHPWVKATGSTSKEKWLNYQLNLLFPEEILDLFEAIEPGQKKAWKEALSDVLASTHEDEPRMVIAGVTTGISVAIVQNGEQLLRLAGIDNSAFLTVASQIGISLIGQGVRWKASETFWNIETFKESAGKAAADLFNHLDVPNEYKGTNWQNLTAQILERFKQMQTDERFSANIKGLTTGLVLGNILFGNLDKAIYYGLVAMGIDYALSKKYPILLKDMIDRFIKTQLDRRAALEKARAKNMINGFPVISSHVDAGEQEHHRRNQATMKNTFQGSISALLPSITALLSNIVSKESLQSQAYTWSVVASTVLDRSDSVMSSRDAQGQGNKAHLEMLTALQSVLQDRERRPPMSEDRNIDQKEVDPEHRRGELIIKKIGTPRYVDAEKKPVDSVELETPLILRTGECALVLGGVQSGKSTLLKILSGRLNGKPELSNITLGGQQIGQAPRETLREIFHVIPLENEQHFSVREKLAKVATEKNILGDFSADQIQDLLEIESVAAAEQSPIVKAFLVYCKKYNILQGKNGIDATWFVGLSYILSGSQQALFNLALSTCFDGNINSKIICADDPTNTLDQKTKEEWRNFVEQRLPESGHKMLIVTNDTYDLAKGTGWLSMKSVGAVLDISQQKVVNFGNFKDLENFMKKDYDDEPELILEQLMEGLETGAKEILAIKHPDKVAELEAIYNEKVKVFIKNLRKLKYFIEENANIEIDYKRIKPIILDLTRQVHSVLVVSNLKIISLENLAEVLYRSDYFEFYAFLLIHEIESFVNATTSVGEEKFLEWRKLFARVSDVSTMDLIIKIQDEIRKAASEVADLKMKKDTFSMSRKLKDLLAFFDKVLYRWAFYYDKEMTKMFQEFFIDVINLGFFDGKEKKLMNFLNIECDSTINNSTLGHFLIGSESFLKEILAAVKYRQLAV